MIKPNVAEDIQITVREGPESQSNMIDKQLFHQLIEIVRNIM